MQNLVDSHNWQSWISLFWLEISLSSVIWFYHFLIILSDSLPWSRSIRGCCFLNFVKIKTSCHLLADVLYNLCFGHDHVSRSLNFLSRGVLYFYEALFSQKSRLHFIGTWRSRYRKRFPSFKDSSSIVNASAQGTSVIHVDMVICTFGAF